MAFELKERLERQQDGVVSLTQTIPGLFGQKAIDVRLLKRSGRKTRCIRVSCLLGDELDIVQKHYVEIVGLERLNRLLYAPPDTVGRIVKRPLVCTVSTAFC